MVVSASAHFKDASADVDMLDVALERTSGMDALKDTVVQNVAPAIEISPLTSLMDGLGGGQSKGAEAKPDSQAQLKQQFTAALSNAKPIWKPTEKLNNDNVARNTVENRQAGQNKTVDANAKMADLKSEIKDITAKMNQGPDQMGADAAGPKQSSLMGSMAGGLARDAVITGGLTAVGMPFAAAAVGAASLAAAVTGRGTFGVANSGEFGRDKVSRSGKVIESGYSRNEPSPSDAQTGPAAPQTNALWNKLAQGPGFGADPRRNVDAGTAELAGQTLTQITALKLAENSPAMLAYKSQRVDGETVKDIHKARIEKGLIADEPNVAQAQNMGIALPENRMTLPGLHV